MKNQLKPKILISKCIEHAPCRYDGTMISSDFVKRISSFVTFIAVCPEVEIGLSIPRESIRILFEDGNKRLVSSTSGQDCTEKMVNFSKNYTQDMLTTDYHGAILKSRSPSCGIKAVKMYKNIGKSASIEEKTAGIFGEAVITSNPLLPIEDEKRLLNYDIREHFLTRIFTLSRYESVKEIGKMSELVKFQSDHKYLLMAYHQTEQKTLGKIVANHQKLPMNEILVEYENHLKKALINPLKKGRNTNMILHMFGYISDKLSDSEKLFFLDELSLYNKNKKPLSVIMTMLYSWIIRFNEIYLMNQIIFRPYPIEMLDVLDSGKGIK
jgi:uncharacterized protein YbgA (DUF1722 family)/uncharacterized protein YbbK (DUF523 family)